MARRPFPKKSKAAKKAPAKKPAKTPSKTKAKGPTAKAAQWVYTFGGGKAEGRAGMKELLGGKGANLAEMANLALPVPPGFTITTAVCTHYTTNDKTYPAALAKQVAAGLAHIARVTGKTFGDRANPLLVSVRSGARASMPGMMDTVLNLGLNDETVEALAQQSGDRRFAYDSYRRFIQMYSNVVLGIEHHNFEDILEDHKSRQGVTLDTELTAEDWVDLVARYQERVVEELGEPFPQEPAKQLWGAIGAVFGSWMNARAITYRRLHNIPESWGTAVNVQAMVFGNMGDTSATGVAFTRNPSTGEKAALRRIRGSPLPRARTWSPASGHRRRSPKRRARKAAPTNRRWKRRCRRPSPSSRASTASSRSTIATCKTWSSRSSRASCGCCRPATASAPRRRRCGSRIDNANEKLITQTRATCVSIRPRSISSLHPTGDPNAELKVIASGLPASPGAASS